METVHVIITGLAVLDIGIMLLAHRFDGQYYTSLKVVNSQKENGHFFVNSALMNHSTTLCGHSGTIDHLVPK